MSTHPCKIASASRLRTAGSIWDEKGRAGYGLYDRALGASYLNGLWEAIQKNNIQRNGQNGAAAV